MHFFKNQHVICKELFTYRPVDVVCESFFTNNRSESSFFNQFINELINSWINQFIVNLGLSQSTFVCPIAWDINLLLNFPLGHGQIYRKGSKELALKERDDGDPLCVWTWCYGTWC